MLAPQDSAAAVPARAKTLLSENRRWSRQPSASLQEILLDSQSGAGSGTGASVGGKRLGRSSAPASFPNRHVLRVWLHERE